MPTNPKRTITNKFVAICVFLFVAISGLAEAEDYTSPSFIIRASVVSEGGSYSSSTNFQLQNSLGETVIGINSGLNFQQLAGFLYWWWPSTATSETPSATVQVSGGGGTISVITTGANFSGRAYPLKKVTILKDGQIAATTIAGPDSNFSVSLTGLSAGNYNFSIYGEDNQDRHSSFFTFPLLITQGAVATVSGIFISPIVGVDKLEVKKGDDIAIFGQTAANANVTVQVNSDEPFFAKTKSDKDGVYLYNFDTSILENGQHLAKSKAGLNEEASSFGKTVSFDVGAKNVFAEVKKDFLKGDLNEDGRVNLIDFSIAAYWHKRSISDSFKLLESTRLSGDNKVDLIDFSIMAYFWTG